MAPVAPSGEFGGSNDTNHVWPLASIAVKPGAKPPLFSRVMVQRSGLGGGPEFGPRTKSSAEAAGGRMRFVNQLESGTSSIVLTLPARTFDDFFAGVTNRL